MKIIKYGLVAWGSLIISLFLFYGVGGAADRIFFEDNEAVTFTEHPLERSYGSSYQAYWDEFKSEVTRSSTNPYSGTYSMTYDPFTTYNPHAVVGSSSTTYGNTSNLNLSNVGGRYWYFRWYQRWEQDIDWGGYIVKLLYINHSPPSTCNCDFGFYLALEGGEFHTTLQNSANGYVANHWDPTSGDLQDNQWHKMEVLLDVGTGTNDGSYWVKVDGVTYASYGGLTFDANIGSNPISYIDGWPANLSGEGGSGTGRTWLDDLEIYVLNGLSDIPSELGGAPVDTPPPAPQAPEDFTKNN